MAVYFMLHVIFLYMQVYSYIAILFELLLLLLLLLLLPMLVAICMGLFDSPCMHTHMG